MNIKRSQSGFSEQTKSSRTRAFVFAMLTAATTAVAAQQTNLSSGLDFNSFKIIPDRNIFNQSRQPREAAAPPPRVADSFSLVGTLFYAGGDIAFFDGTSDEYRRALKVGGAIAGFKVTAVTLNSVTLLDGTNQIFLKISSQMRRDDAGHWSVSTERASYASLGNAAGSNPGGYSGRSRHFNINRGNSTRMTGAEQPPASEIKGNPSGIPTPGGAYDALARMMQRRAQEEQRLKQGQ